LNILVTGAGLIDAHTADAEVLKLCEPAPAAKIFDFSVQREVNQELGIK
jgi:hypothetical protein